MSENIILLMIAVLVVLALVLYAVSLIPLPGPGFIKQLIMALIVLGAAVFIAHRAGIF